MFMGDLGDGAVAIDHPAGRLDLVLCRERPACKREIRTSFQWYPGLAGSVSTGVDLGDQIFRLGGCNLHADAVFDERANRAVRHNAPYA